MKKFIFAGVLVFTLLCSISVAVAQEKASGAAGAAIAQEQAQPQAEAWIYCFQDTEFSAFYEFSVDDGGYVRGQAVDDAASPFASITGTLKGSKLQIGVAYFGGTGIRFYNMKFNKKTIAKSKGATWGIVSPDSTYYDSPHETTFAPCP